MSFGAGFPLQPLSSATPVKNVGKSYIEDRDIHTGVTWGPNRGIGCVLYFWFRYHVYRIYKTQVTEGKARGDWIWLLTITYIQDTANVEKVHRVLLQGRLSTCQLVDLSTCNRVYWTLTPCPGLRQNLLNYIPCGLPALRKKCISDVCVMAYLVIYVLRKQLYMVAGRCMGSILWDIGRVNFDTDPLFTLITRTIRFMFGCLIYACASKASFLTRW